MTNVLGAMYSQQKKASRIIAPGQLLPTWITSRACTCFPLLSYCTIEQTRGKKYQEFYLAQHARSSLCEYAKKQKWAWCLFLSSSNNFFSSLKTKEVEIHTQKPMLREWSLKTNFEIWFCIHFDEHALTWNCSFTRLDKNDRIQVEADLLNLLGFVSHPESVSQNNYKSSDLQHKVTLNPELLQALSTYIIFQLCHSP